MCIVTVNLLSNYFLEKYQPHDPNENYNLLQNMILQAKSKYLSENRPFKKNINIKFHPALLQAFSSL